MHGFKEEPAESVDIFAAAWTGMGECDYETAPLCTVMLDMSYCAPRCKRRDECTLLAPYVFRALPVRMLIAFVISPRERHFPILACA